ncbi:MAG: DUF5856 family protein [Bellilinea sp.]
MVMTKGMISSPKASDTENDGDATLMGQLVMKLFDARTSAHVQHLRAGSYAQHMALNSFYDEIAGLADSIAEAWQGAYQKKLTFPNPGPLTSDPLASLKTLRTWIEDNRGAACDDSEIQNVIDEVMQLIDSTMYKLRFLV